MIKQMMAFPEIGQISALISEVEILTGSKIIVLLSDMFRPPDERSIDLAFNHMEQMAIKERDQHGEVPELLLILHGGAKFSRTSLLKMRVLSQKYSLKMIVSGNTASLFTAFLATGQVLGNIEMYKEMKYEMFNVPAEELVVDFLRTTSQLSFLPLNEDEIQNLILKNNVTKIDSKTNAENAVDLTGVHEVFLRYIKSMEEVFNFREGILGRNLGFNPVNPNSINYTTQDIDLKKLVSLLSELNVKFSKYIAMKNGIFLSFLSSNFEKETSDNSGVWQ